MEEVDRLEHAATIKVFECSCYYRVSDISKSQVQFLTARLATHFAHAHLGAQTSLSSMIESGTRTNTAGGHELIIRSDGHPNGRAKFRRKCGQSKVQHPTNARNCRERMLVCLCPIALKGIDISCP